MGEVPEEIEFPYDDPSEENEVNEEFHFQPGELLFNLRQIFFDDYRNTKSVNEIFFGDQAQVYKNAEIANKLNAIEESELTVT